MLERVLTRFPVQLQFSLAQAHFANQIISMQNTYRQIDAILRVNMSSGQIDVRFRAIKSREEECQTHHCQPQSTNIEDKFQTEQLRPS